MFDFSVAVIITCYDQGRFLADAISSVLAQTQAPAEIVVVDDGSVDETMSVTLRYPQVRYSFQPNKGLASARNAGLQLTTAQYVTFLDADDMLAPGALAEGMRAFGRNPDCAFVAGDYRLVGPDLRPLFRFRRRPVMQDHYAAFLRGNWVGMHATVMYRREPLWQSGGFDESLKACEDYSVYLRLSRNHKVFCHGAVVADYRQHDANMSRNPEFMLKWALAVHGAERPFLHGDPALLDAHNEGEANLRRLYEDAMLLQLKNRLRVSSPNLMFRRLLFVASDRRLYAPLWREAVETAVRIGKGAARRLNRTTIWPRVGHVKLGSFRTHKPHNVLQAGCCSVEEWYCRQWQEEFEQDVRGRVLDLSVTSFDLQTLKDTPSDSYDTILCFLCLQRAFDLGQTFSELNRILKPSGVLLGMLPGTAARYDAPDHEDWWRFTALSAREILNEVFDNVHVRAFGNVLTALGALHCLPASEFRTDELLDASAQLIVAVGIRAVKQPVHNNQHEGG